MLRKVSSKAAGTDEYSILRVTTTLLVVAAHITIIYSALYSVIQMPISRPFHWLTVLIYSFHMPLFVFLSGAVYRKCIDMGKYRHVFPFLKGKLLRLMLPYLAVGCLWVAPCMVLLGFTEKRYPQYVWWGIVTNHDSRHLWYLWTLFCLFVIIRLLYAVLRKKGIAELLLLMSAVLYVMRGSLPTICSKYRIAEFLVFFLLGYVFAGHKPMLDRFLNGKRWLAVPVLLWMIYMTVCYSNWHPICSLLMACGGIFVSYCAAGAFGHLLTKTRLYALLYDNSMGIYLLHPMLNYIVFFLVQGKNISPYVLCPVLFVGVTAISCVLSVCIRKTELRVLLGG